MNLACQIPTTDFREEPWNLSIPMKFHPPSVRLPLDSGLQPAVLWNRAYQKLCDANPGAHPLAIAIESSGGTVSRFRTDVLPHTGAAIELNRKHAERLMKFALWSRGGFRVHVGGDRDIAQMLARIYGPSGERQFDNQFMGTKVYRELFEVVACDLDEVPAARQVAKPLGGHFDGCRIGFDLGGSHRKCAAVIDGDCVFSEEVPWDPYFQSDPRYHHDAINDSLKRAAAHLPRVDAIGGSCAGIFVGSEVRIASIFRGVSLMNFSLHSQYIFQDLKEEWGGVPFEVVNDGAAAALAGAARLGIRGVLGISMGTSLAAGYVTPEGGVTPWLNELAFAPLDYRDDAPVDEWSGDRGCGSEYFSFHGVARLAALAGLKFPAEMKAAEQFAEVQRLFSGGDGRARHVFETIGMCFGYAIAQYAGFYDFRHLLALGGVTSGESGNFLLAKAGDVLRMEFPELAGRIEIHTVSERHKFHGQAIAAASLPSLSKGA
jgi:predicted NBD/HSP70 family sugar kinase